MKQVQSVWKVTLADGKTVRYRARVDIAYDPVTKERKQQRKTFTNQREAEAWVKATQTDVARGRHVAPAPRTMGEHLQQWLEGRQNLRDSTRACYRGALVPYIDELGGVPLQKLTRQQLEGVRDRLSSGELRRVGIRGGPSRVGGASMAARTVRLGLGLVQQALDDAVRDDLVLRNVAQHVERPSGEGKSGAAWSPEQAQAFRGFAMTDRIAGAWALSLLGLRRGEVVGMRWDHVDLDRGQVNVEHTRVYVAGEVLPSSPKTKRGKRVVPLPAWAVEALRRTRDQQGTERVAIGDAYGPGDHVASDELGNPVRPKWYSDAFTRLARAADVPVIRLHDARHTSVTLMRAAGVPDPVAAAWHGHSEAVMRATYTHVSIDAMRAVAETMK